MARWRPCSTTPEFAVDAVATATAALARKRRARGYTAIAVDPRIADMTVVQLMAALRRRPETREVPVVIAAEHGVDDALSAYAVTTVPLDAAELVASLARAGVRPDRPGGVLVVDDDPSALRLMNAALAQHGIVSIARSTGASGLDAAARLQPAAIVVDLVMPGMDGHEFLEHLRRLPAHARTPVLVWTVKDLDDRERTWLRANTQAIAAKADSPLGVVHQIRALLGGS